MIKELQANFIDCSLCEVFLRLEGRLVVFPLYYGSNVPSLCGGGLPMNTWTVVLATEAGDRLPCLLRKRGRHIPRLTLGVALLPCTCPLNRQLLRKLAYNAYYFR